jgi:hypothetical protein
MDIKEYEKKVIHYQTSIDNANDVLNSPMTYPTFAQYKSFHTNEMNTRNMWARIKKESEEKEKLESFISEF